MDAAQRIDGCRRCREEAMERVGGQTVYMQHKRRRRLRVPFADREEFAAVARSPEGEGRCERRAPTLGAGAPFM